ncbi:hypothetical protein AQJ11_20000 [Streptomyces corchorusii]|uniref:Uncharacterized protein n=1 Tax=Streptomyces corchorusii TaxID=1903 RepID=A0A117QFL2_STRCK|nr:hypothetical protein [Streptomyces corchorusii]KUN25693.1 hypothetical protein AQJ11_20000 [Streptomyces corchorusii]
MRVREDYIDHTVALVRRNRTLVLALTSYVPWGSLGFAPLLLALSLWLEARARPQDPAGTRTQEPEPVSA